MKHISKFKTCHRPFVHYYQFQLENHFRLLKGNQAERHEANHLFNSFYHTHFRFNVHKTLICSRLSAFKKLGRVLGWFVYDLKTITMRIPKKPETHTINASITTRVASENLILVRFEATYIKFSLCNILNRITCSKYDMDIFQVLAEFIDDGEKITELNISICEPLGRLELAG